MDQTQRREIPNNYGDGLSIAFELVLTPAVFGVLGWLADRALGTTPLFTIVLSLTALAVVTGLTIWRYEHEMRRSETARRAAVAERRHRPARWERAEAALAAEAAALDAQLPGGDRTRPAHP